MRPRPGEGSLVCLDGLRETPSFSPKIPELEQGIGVTGLERDGSAQRLLGLLRMPIAK